MSLPTIPVVDARAGGPAAAADALPLQLAALLAAARRRYTPLGLALGDAVSRRWLRRNANPYLREIEAVADRLGAPGAHALNLSYEWACTTGLRAAGQAGAGTVMLRVLDWRLHGLGRNLAVIHRSGPAGEWLDLGWPGFVGSVTALAPGRFAIAINQPPLPSRTGFGLVGDWLAARGPVWRSRALPPAHLVRLVCDTAADFTQAAAMLLAERVSTAAFFALAGSGDGEACVIERTAEGRAALRPAAPSVAVANHWVATPVVGRPRGRASADRQRQMEALLARHAAPADFGLAWLAPPILNDDTRVVAVMEAATGRFVLQGFERGGRPATQSLRL